MPARAGDQLLRQRFRGKRVSGWRVLLLLTDLQIKGILLRLVIDLHYFIVY
jgi:hypothetical protein